MKNKTKTILFASLIAVIVIPFTSSAFAAESFPSWSTHQDAPSGWGCSNECYADSASTGVNDVYALSNQGYETRDASVHNNSQWNPVVTTNALELTTDNSLVGMEIDIVYDGSMSVGFGGVAELWTGLDLYKDISGNWLKVSGCYDTLTASDDLTDSQTLDCTATNAGENDYRAGATHRAHAFNWFGGQTTIVDFYDQGVGDSNKVETDRLEICAGVC